MRISRTISQIIVAGVFVTLTALIASGSAFATELPEGAELIPVNTKTDNTADYSVDVDGMTIPEIRWEIIEDYLKDKEKDDKGNGSSTTADEMKTNLPSGRMWEAEDNENAEGK